MTTVTTTSELMDYSIAITVDTQYLQSQSDPKNSTFAFAYHITIQNNRLEDVRLLSRHWIITDKFNNIEEVKGPGVIGQQPLIKPGQSFQYSSGTILKTEIGDMRGSYTMELANGDLFEAPIPLFILAIPSMIH